MVLNYPELFDGCIPVSSGFMPSISQLETLEKNGVNVLMPVADTMNSVAIKRNTAKSMTTSQQ